MHRENSHVNAQQERSQQQCCFHLKTEQFRGNPWMPELHLNRQLHTSAAAHPSFRERTCTSRNLANARCMPGGAADARGQLDWTWTRQSHPKCEWKTRRRSPIYSGGGGGASPPPLFRLLRSCGGSDVVKTYLLLHFASAEFIFGLRKVL